MNKAILTVTAKGQVTLRKKVLEHLGVGPGDRIVVELLPAGRAEVHAAQCSIESFFGSLAKPGEQSLTIEQMNELAARGWAGDR
jgi:antitoxin PrlF